MYGNALKLYVEKGVIEKKADVDKDKDVTWYSEHRTSLPDPALQQADQPFHALSPLCSPVDGGVCENARLPERGETSTWMRCDNNKLFSLYEGGV